MKRYHYDQVRLYSDPAFLIEFTIEVQNEKPQPLYTSSHVCNLSKQLASVHQDCPSQWLPSPKCDKAILCFPFLLFHLTFHVSQQIQL